MNTLIGTTARTAGLFAAALLIAQVALAAELHLAVGEMAVVSNPADAGECRLLLAFNRPAELEGAVILLAVLKIEVPQGARVGELPPIEVFFCEREWPEGLVSWDEGWESGNGVWDESGGALVDVGRADTGLVLTADATGVLRTAVQSSAERPALILVPWLSTPGLAAALRESSASLDVKWMPVERARRGQR